MDVSPKQVTIVIALTVIAVLIMGVFGWLVFHISSYAEEGQDTVKVAEITTYKNLADTYYARLGFYSGLCESIGVSNDYVCQANDEQYRITIPAREGYLCIDVDNPVRYYKSLGEGMLCRP